MDEPSTAARMMALMITRKHHRLFHFGEPINALIDDIAAAIDTARSVGESAAIAREAHCIHEQQE